MKYIIIELQKNAEGNVSHIVKTADSEREAESIYHAPQAPLFIGFSTIEPESE